jgi:hypothetical protein
MKTYPASLICALIGLLPLAAEAADGATPFDPGYELGLEVQVYPSGIITSGRFGFMLSDQWAMDAYLGWNFVTSRTRGEHDTEEGGGPGVGLGARWYYGLERTSWYLGGRVDVWFLDIDWEDSRLFVNTSGSTDVTVLQPTVQAGYAWALSPELRVEVGVSLGSEFNIATSGESVGSGFIILGGVSANYRF